MAALPQRATSLLLWRPPLVLALRAALARCRKRVDPGLKIASLDAIDTLRAETWGQVQPDEHRVGVEGQRCAVGFDDLVQPLVEVLRQRRRRGRDGSGLRCV